MQKNFIRLPVQIVFPRKIEGVFPLRIKLRGIKRRELNIPPRGGKLVPARDETFIRRFRRMLGILTPRREREKHSHSLSGIKNNYHINIDRYQYSYSLVLGNQFC
ncbi:hypothetical protein A2963_02585 [Candidatus Roizmanbacteria bacterium RIFCSPLOWO2_01_FULL_40_13]|nr:MAG: hypothetical protein A2963_02585 [Candidatus Roizmanbacteria bacterium RIFCSPLOWO2_01_FULL_40_13]